jgi:hypothetical protein
MNLITEIVRKHLILEKRIATIKANITISYDVKTDSHAKDRQKERNISRGDIILQLEKAKNEITTKIVTGELEDGDIFIVRSRSSNLFIPVILFKETDYMFDLKIMSVYRKEADGRPQHTIWVD